MGDERGEGAREPLRTGHLAAFLTLIHVIAASFAARTHLFLRPTYYAEEALGAAAARAIAGGAAPYAGFFYAHPPAFIYANAAFLLATGLPPLLSSKILSLILSALSALVVYKTASSYAGRGAGLLAAALFCASFGFFYWHSLSLPLPLLSLLLLLAHHFLEVRRAPRAAGLFLCAAILTEFSAAIWAAAYLAAFRRNAREILLAVAICAAAALLIGVATGGAFLSQAVLSQTIGRARASQGADNASVFYSFLLVYALPLIAVALLRAKDPLFVSAAVCGAVLLALFPGVTNNTPQFLIPFLAISASTALSGSRFRRIGAVFALLFAMATAAMLARGDLLSDGAPHLPEIAALVRESAGAGGSVWGTPEAVLASLESGVPLAGGEIDLTPTSVSITGPPSRRPDVLVVSDYYYGQAPYAAYADPSSYSQAGEVIEPVVGRIRILRRTG